MSDFRRHLLDILDDNPVINSINKIKVIINYLITKPFGLV